MGFAVKVGGFSATVAALEGISEVAASRLITATAGAILVDEVRQTIGETDHSLRDLAALDHPYARRHGSIQIHRDKPQTVHSQSGAMASALRSESDDLLIFGNRLGIFRIWFDLSVAPHARYILQGTRKMLARDVLWDTANDKRVIVRMNRAIVTLLGKELRTKARLRLGPLKTVGGSRTGT